MKVDSYSVRKDYIVSIKSDGPGTKTKRSNLAMVSFMVPEFFCDQNFKLFISMSSPEL